MAPSGIVSSSSSTKTAPRSRSSLDDVLVVHDLLAHVDRRAVELERALDGLDGPVDAGAVAARRGEQELLDHAAQRSLPCTRRSSTIVSPTASMLRAQTALMSSRVVCQTGNVEVDEVDRRDAALLERRVVVEHAPDARSGNDARRRRRARAAARSCAHSPRSELASRGIRRPCRPRVEQDERADLLSRGRRRRPCEPRSPPSRNSTPAGASSPSKRTKRSSRRARRALDAPQRARELDDHDGARRAVVGADEPRGVERVVVRAEHDRGLRAGQRADDVLHARRVPGHRLEAPGRQQRRQARGEPARGVGPRGTGPERDLLAQEAPRPGAVEARGRRAWRSDARGRPAEAVGSGSSAWPGSGKPWVPHTTSAMPRATWIARTMTSARTGTCDEPCPPGVDAPVAIRSRMAGGDSRRSGRRRPHGRWHPASHRPCASSSWAPCPGSRSSACSGPRRSAEPPSRPG